MDFDQIVEAWKTQDKEPLYSVNQDQLRVVLRGEQVKIRRQMRLSQLITYLTLPGMALFAAFWLWVATLNGNPLVHVAAAGLVAMVFAGWLVAFFVSRRRQARRERAFGDSIRDEIGRSLSQVEFQIAHGRWRGGLVWSAPVVIGALLLQWLTFQINTDNALIGWDQVLITTLPVWAVGLVCYGADLKVRRTLEPRRERLQQLLDQLKFEE